MFDDNEDLLSLITVALHTHNEEWVTHGASVSDVWEGKLNLGSYLETTKPDVIIWDVVPPYELNWQRLQKLAEGDGVLRNYPVIVTSTNVARLREATGVKEAVELVGKPYDLNSLYMAVTSALALAKKEE